MLTCSVGRIRNYDLARQIRSRTHLHCTALKFSTEPTSGERDCATVYHLAVFTAHTQLRISADGCSFQNKLVVCFDLGTKICRKGLAALRESIPRLLNEGSTAMTACCAPACSQALPVKPQGVWARGIEAWARSHDRRNWSCGGGGLPGPPA